jgi:trans-aconitate methyltransferase
MAKWHFWGDKEFSDVYENIYIRSVVEDWYRIVLVLVQKINQNRTKNKLLLDIGCGEGHTTKQILDRVKGKYVCDLLEPDAHALTAAEAFLVPENSVGKCYPQALATFQPGKKYDFIFTSHTNYYWALNQKDYDRQLVKLRGLLKPGGKLLILTLPKESDHYRIMLRQIYPTFNYAQYIINFYQRQGAVVKVKKLKMRMFIGDLLGTKKLFDLKTFYRFIHNTDSYPNSIESAKFLKNIKRQQHQDHLDFRDYLIEVKA